MEAKMETARRSKTAALPRLLSVVLRNSRHEQVVSAPWSGAPLAIVGFQFSDCASEEKGLVSTYASNLDTSEAIADREDGFLASAARDVGEGL